MEDNKRRNTEQTARNITGEMTADHIRQGVIGTAMHYMRALMVENTITREEAAKIVIDLFKDIITELHGEGIHNETDYLGDICVRLGNLRAELVTRGLVMSDLDSLYAELLEKTQHETSSN